MHEENLPAAGEDGEPEDIFGKPIVVYSKEQAIEDGVLWQVESRLTTGQFAGRFVVVTAHLLAEMTKEQLLTALIRGMNTAAELDLTAMVIGGTRIFVEDNGREITFMLPDDY